MAESSSGLVAYLREAFLFRWNLLLFLGGGAAAALTPVPEVLLPLVAAGELVYLAGLISIPRFRAAVDAKVHSERGSPVKAPPPLPKELPLVSMLQDLPGDLRQRFQRLHARCRDLRAIAADVGGSTGSDSPSMESIGTPGLDRLLWLFLRLLMSKHALDRFLSTTNEQEITGGLAQLKGSLQRAQAESDERVVRSLQDSVAMAELRLDNHARAKKNSQFVSIELDRIENKIHALAEMTVNRQDPDFLSSQVDSAAESMRQTEKAVSELQHLTGLGEQLDEPPPILDSNLREVLRHDA
jgi:hypothetical protein